MIHRQLLRSCIVALLPLAPSMAQQFPLMLSTTVNPPYTASYVQYFQNPQQVSVLVHNDFPGATDHEVYFAGSISTLDGTISVRVEGGQPWNAPPLHIPVGFSSLTGNDLEPLISNGSGQLQYSGITEEDIRLGLLPEGEYQVCLQAFDYITNEPLSAGAPSDGCSNIFTISYPPPPELLSPMCDELVDGLQPQTVLFNWILPSGPPIGASMQYHFKLVLLAEDDQAIDPLSALQTSMDPVWEDDVLAPQVLYTQLMPALLQGRRYAWYVRAVDMNGQHTFQNDGWSQPCTFTWSFDVEPWIGNTTDGNFELVYPALQDTLPWSLMPVIVRFDPHQAPDTTKEFGSTLVMTQNGSPHSTTYRNGVDDPILWNSGPFLSQRHLLNAALHPDPVFTEEEAHQINVYKNDVPPNLRFSHGSRYRSDATVTIAKKEGRQPISGNVGTEFVSGMGRPRSLHPANNSELPAIVAGDPEPVELRFRTADPPQALLPPFPIYIIQSGQVSQTQGTIDERWILQVARDEAFTQVVHTADGRLGEGLQLNDPDCGSGCLEQALYKELNVPFTPTANGTYYWRVAWLLDPETLQGDHYHSGPIWRFTIGEGDGEEGGGDGDPVPEEEIPSADCLAESRRSPTPAAQRVAVTSIAVGDTVQVGKFKLHISTIHYAGSMAHGEGLIDVPVMRAKLRVRFSNALINAQKRLYDGLVQGLYDNEGVIPPAWATGTSLAAGFSPSAAQAIDDYLNTAGRLVSQFAGNAPMGLPIGVDKEVEGLGRVVVGILGIQFTDTIARLNAGLSLPIPELGTSVSLGNMAMPFHPGGFGDLSEEATLYLLSDLDVGMGDDTLKLKGARFLGGFTTVQDSGTFVAWDCHGFRAITFDAEYRFSRDKLREDLPNGNEGPQKVVGALRVRTGRGGIMGRLDLNTPFHLTHAKDWGFDVQEAWLDLASYTNPPEMHLPERHFLASEHMQEDGTVDPAWTGVYVERTMLRMPPAIERFEGSGRVTAQVDDFIYGFGEGVSASFKVSNVLATDQGNLDGWGFSLDTLQMDIVLNTFSQGGFKGRIRLPISDTLLLYSGMIQHSPTTSDTRLEFLLHPDGTLNVPMYVGDIALLETSTVRAVFGDATTGTTARAELNGKLSIDVTTPFNINFRDIAFQGLYFQTDAPYTNAGENSVFSLASPQKYMGGSGALDDADEEEENKAGGFPISITRVTTERRDSEGGIMAGIGFDINLDLSGETNIFVATTRIAVLGQLNTTEIHKWGHHKIELDSIGVTGETGAVKIIGGLRWYHDDPTYGNGINGAVRAWFLKGALEVATAAQFGTVNSTRYWFADAMIAKNEGFSPGQPFNVYGFGGGAWYHMRRTGDMPSAKQVTEATIANQDDDSYTPGLTLSRVVYVPDANEAFGFKATVIFGDGASGRAYNGDLTAGMTFSTTGGVSTAFLDGNVYLMSERNERDYVPIRGTAHIEFDFPNDVFQANFQVFVTIGSGLVTGTGANDLAGGAEILITPDTWHFFVGTPQTPIGLDFRGLFGTESYFMVGKDLPDPMPPDSAAVLALMNGGDFSWPSSVSTANGVAFGARGELDEEFDFYLLRMHLMAGAGLDMAFISSSEMQCGDNPDPGISGFYATGQVYAYLGGSVSLHVDVWFAEGDFEIMKLAAAARLEGGFADPSWVKGAVGGSYSILGGLIDGTFNFPFEAGTPCDAYGAGALAGLDPISDITPHHLDGIAPGTPAVDVGMNGEIALNLKLDTPFDLKDYRPNGTAYWRTFRMKLDAFQLKKGGTELSGTIEVAPDKKQVLLIPGMYLDPFTTYTLTVKMRAEERNSNGGWATALNQGEPALWDTTVTFKTGQGLTQLREQDLEYTYPFIGQRYVLQDECRSAVIQCKSNLSNQDALFGTAPNGRIRIYKMILTPRTGGPHITCVANVQHVGKTAIYFNLPALTNGMIYTAQFIRRDSLDQGGMGPSHTAGDLLGANAYMVMTSTTANSTNVQGEAVRLRQRKLAGYSVKANEKLLFTYHFRTSAHNTIGAKAAALSNNATFMSSDGAVPPRETLMPNFMGERFDVFDVRGYQNPNIPSARLKPLVRLQDARTDTWSSQWSKPVLYDYYAEIKSRNCSPLDLVRSATTNAIGIPIISDSPDTIGIPPMNTVYWRPGAPVMEPLTAAEVAPPPTNGMTGGYAGSMVVLQPGETLVDVGVDVRTSFYVRDDYTRLATITSDVCSRCGVLYGETPMAEPLRSMAIRYLDSPYRRPYRGNYGVKFMFIPPPTCQPFTDWNENVPVSSGNATFQYTLGPLPPMNAPNTSGVNTGGIQTAP